MLLDIIMVVVILTLFDKNFISMRYHEIAGLLLIGSMVIHNVVNIKTFLGMGKNFKKMPLRFQIGFVVDLLLMVCFLWIGVSGILCAHTSFTWISSKNIFFKLSHMFAGGLSVLLLGIHIGLHMRIKKASKKRIAVMSVLILGIGLYGLHESDELKWLSIPYTSFSQTEGVSKESSEKRNGMREGRMNGKSHKEFKKEGSGKERQNGDNAKLVFVTKGGIQSFVMFFGMIFSVAVITYWVVYEKKRRIHRPLLVGNTTSKELKRISTQEQK